MRVEALIRIGFGMVRDCIDGLSYVIVWFGFFVEDLVFSCSYKFNKVVFWMVFEGFFKIEVVFIK